MSSLQPVLVSHLGERRHWDPGKRGQGCRWMACSTQDATRQPRAPHVTVPEQRDCAGDRPRAGRGANGSCWEKASRSSGIAPSVSPAGPPQHPLQPGCTHGPHTHRHTCSHMGLCGCERGQGLAGPPSRAAAAGAWSPGPCFSWEEPPAAPKGVHPQLTCTHMGGTWEGQGLRGGRSEDPPTTTTTTQQSWLLQARECGPRPAPPLGQSDTGWLNFKSYLSRNNNQQQLNKTTIHRSAERGRGPPWAVVSGHRSWPLAGQLPEVSGLRARLAGQVTHWSASAGCCTPSWGPRWPGRRGREAAFKTSLCRLLGCVPWVRCLTSLSLGFLPS